MGPHRRSETEEQMIECRTVAVANADDAGRRCCGQSKCVGENAQEPFSLL